MIRAAGLARVAALPALLLIALSPSGCHRSSSAVGDDTPRSPRELASYRWTIELRADSSLFDQGRAPEALRRGPFVLQASVSGERIAPDRQRARATVRPVAIEPRESITIGRQRWYRIGDGPWRTGGEALLAARAHLGGSVSLDGSAIFEASATPAVLQLREAIARMPYREEQMETGLARRYTLEPEQVRAII